MAERVRGGCLAAGCSPEAPGSERETQAPMKSVAGKTAGGSPEGRGLNKSSTATIEGCYLSAWDRDSEEGRARSSEQIFYAQKMETLGTLTAGIAHDFNNLLSVMLGIASGVRLRLHPDDPLREPIHLIEQSAERAAELARQLLGFARPDTEPTAPLPVGEVLGSVANLIRRTLDGAIQLRTDWAADLPGVETEPSSLEQAILNLCINAREAMPEGGTLTLTASLVRLGPEARSHPEGTRRPGPGEASERAEDVLLPLHCPAGDYLEISVRDTGGGIDPQVMPRIFQPFFTTKEPGKGSGLGLTMVRKFAEAHRGFVRVRSRVGQGTEVALLLPAVPAPAPPATPESPPQLRRGGWGGAVAPLRRRGGTILVVDDEPLVLAFLEEGLTKMGYKVLVAANGTRALEVYAARRAEIRAVLLDVVLPESRGFEICRQLRKINPRLHVVLSSGYSSRGWAREARAAGAVDFLAKPYTLERLLAALERNAPG